MRYLSDDWLHAADQALVGLPALRQPVVIGFAVTNGPEGTRQYSLRLGPDQVGMEPGLDGAGVVLTLDWALAVAISQHAESAQRAFLDGGLRLAGDVNLLLGHAAILADFDDRLAPLRTLTDYGTI